MSFFQQGDGTVNDFSYAKMPPAARGSFEKPPLDPTKLFDYLFFYHFYKRLQGLIIT